jgi:HlyD family secretion protein
MKPQRRLILIVLVLLVAGAVVYSIATSSPHSLTLTGIVTTNNVIVSPQIGGQIDQLLVKEGDAVKRDQLIATIAPDELKADSAFYQAGAQGAVSQVAESQAALRFQERQTTDQIGQAEATLASILAQQKAAEADMESARLTFQRDLQMSKEGVISIDQYDQARTAYDAAQAKVDALKKQVDAQRSTVALARSNAEQNAMRRSQLQANQQQQAAATAQSAKAEVRLAYTEVRSPIDAVVDVCAARLGEVVNAGQAIVSLINPDDLWVRVDVEETYIDSVKIGDHLKVRLPSGADLDGTVFYRGVDAAFATQRDVSRTKRDIKTFEVRLRVDNRDRRLAVGMTAYVTLPI